MRQHEQHAQPILLDSCSEHPCPLIEKVPQEEPAAAVQCSSKADGRLRGQRPDPNKACLPTPNSIVRMCLYIHSKMRNIAFQNVALGYVVGIQVADVAHRAQDGPDHLTDQNWTLAMLKEQHHRHDRQHDTEMHAPPA